MSRFHHHNRFWSSIEEFLDQDKHIADLRQYRYLHQFSWQDELEGPGIHMLYGPRQIGKSTSIKLFIKQLLLERNIPPRNVFYLACDSLSDRRDLYTTLQHFYEDKGSQEECYVFIDEATYLSDWSSTIKSLIDEGLFRYSTVVITSSDSVLLEDAAASFPGIDRRQEGKDFHLLPLEFKDFLGLIQFEPESDYLAQELILTEHFQKFLVTGGYPNTINHFLEKGEISSSLYSVYKQWVVSDFLRKGKDRQKLIDLLHTVYLRVASQVSYNTLARESSSLSTDTVIDYLEHLTRLGIVRVLSALDQNKLRPAPKKDKKIHFCDPLYAKVIHLLLAEEGLLSKSDSLSESTLVEGVAVDFCARRYPTYYMKADGEVDITVVQEKKFFPIEVKWSKQTSERDLKQLVKYPNGLLLRKKFVKGKVGETPAMPLIEFLLEGQCLLDLVALSANPSTLR